MQPSGVSLQKYLREVALASSRFQYLEEGPKMYLAECFRVIALGVRGRIAFKYSDKGVADQPLGSLIRLFEKYSDKADVIKMLKGLPKERNHVAHSAYLLTVEEIHDPAKIAPEFERVRAIAEKADRAVKAMIQEIHSIEAVRKEMEAGA